MTDKIRILLEDVQTVYEGKGMIVHPNSFDQLRTEVIKLDNINKQLSEQVKKENTGIKDFIVKNKKVCKELAEEYRQRYNKDKDNRLALNMFYHNVIAFNSFEDILAEIENRNPEIMCFSSPPILTEETVEVNLKQIAELKKENKDLKALRKYENNVAMAEIDKLQAENEELKEKMVKLEEENAEAKEIIKYLTSGIREICIPNVKLTNVDLFLKEAEDFIKE